MPTMTDTLQQLVDTVDNGARGYADGAEKLRKDGRPELAATFAELSRQRVAFSNQLRDLDPDVIENGEKDGSVAGAAHRGWMALKDAISGNNPSGVLDAAEQGEDHAVEVFSAALDVDLPAPVRMIVNRQYVEIKAAHDRVRALRDSN